MTATIPEMVCFLGFGGLLVWAAVSDFRRYLIPNWLCLAVAALYPIYLAFSARPVDWQGGLIAGAAVLAVGIGLYALKLTGGGDVKLLAATSLWAGTELVLPLLLVMALAGGVLALGFLASRIGAASVKDSDPASGGTGETTVTAALTRTRLPYGVAIATGGLYVAALLVIG